MCPVKGEAVGHLGDGCAAGRLGLNLFSKGTLIAQDQRVWNFVGLDTGTRRDGAA